MRSVFLVLALQLFLIHPAYAEEVSSVEAIKTTLSSLKKNVAYLSQGVNRLKQDKVSIEKSLKDMEEWGNSEQEAKEQYFKQSVELGKEIVEAQKTIDEDKRKITELRESYLHVKNILGIVTGAFAVLLYLRLGASLVGTFAGPYSIFLTFLGPAGAFTIGYTLVRLFL
jgi:hypothetical protein